MNFLLHIFFIVFMSQICVSLKGNPANVKDIANYDDGSKDYAKGKIELDKNNDENAYKLFRSGSIKGNHAASYNIGLIYKDNATKFNTHTDVKEWNELMQLSKTWFWVAHYQGNEDAMVQIKKIKHIPFSYSSEETALAWLRSFTVDGFPKSQYIFGKLIHENNINDPEAIEWLTKSANYNIGSCRLLAKIYSMDEDINHLLYPKMNYYSGRFKNNKLAVQYCRAAARKGDVISQVSLGNMYYDYILNNWDGDSSRKLYKQKIDSTPNIDADNLTNTEERSLSDEIRKTSEAIEQIGNTFEGFTNSIVKLDVIINKPNKDSINDIKIFNDLISIEKELSGLERLEYTANDARMDLINAWNWYSKPAYQGNAYAQHKLARCLYLFPDFHKDLINAYAWANIAQANGFNNVDIDILKRMLNEDQILKAIEVSKDLVRKNKNLIRK